MSAPDDHPGMEIDLLKGSSRTLLNRVLLAQETWIAIAILVLGLVVSMIAPKFATPGNLLNVFQNACFIGIMAIGMTPVIISGGIDISVGSILGMCGVTLGIVLNADMPLVVGIAATLAMGVLCGTVNGTIIAYVKLPPFIVTLATLSIGRSLALVLTNNQVFYEFGRASDAIVALGGGYTFGLPNVVYALVIGVVVLHFLLTMSRWGRYLFAIGGNEPAARLSGIPVDLDQDLGLCVQRLHGCCHRHLPRRLAGRGDQLHRHRLRVAGHRLDRHRRRLADRRLRFRPWRRHRRHSR